MKEWLLKVFLCNYIWYQQMKEISLFEEKKWDLKCNFQIVI